MNGSFARKAPSRKSGWPSSIRTLRRQPHQNQTCIKQETRKPLNQKLLFATVAVFCCATTQAQFASDLLSGRFKADGVVAPFYDGIEQTPSMVMRADAIYTDYERKAFFRIGVLPLGVMEGVTFELRRPESLTNSLANMRRWVGAQAAKRFEFRKVNFLVFEGSTNRLESGRARFISDGSWELLDGVRFHSGTNQVAAPRATLQIAGEHTGQFVMTTDPPYTNNLFARSEFPSAKQKENP